MVVGLVSWITVCVTVFIGAVLEIVALPDVVSILRPEWLCLWMIYWLLRHPEKVGTIFALIVGLLMDILSGTFLGIHMLSLSIVAYLVLTMHQRLKMFPIFQQATVIFFLVAIHLMIVFTLRANLSVVEGGMDYLWQALCSALVWPIVLVAGDRLSYALR